jgi:methionyl-tRNA synthetase
MNRRTFLLTSALPYANGDLHVGHLMGAYLPADIFARFRRLQGHTVYTVCGSDDYGVAIVLSADKEQTTPKELSAKYQKRQKKALEGMGITFDVFSATSQNPFHQKTCQDFFLSLYHKGAFTKKVSEQFYDPHRGSFLPDRFVKGTCSFCGAHDQNGDQCEQCGKMLDVSTLRDPYSVFNNLPAEVRATTHWYLNLASYQELVRSWLSTASVRPPTRSFVEGFLETGLVERSMTRDIEWGIPVPLDDPDAQGKVLYVWFDAPLGYVSNTEELFSRQNLGEAHTFWTHPDTEIFHFIGEDNTVFHCVVWIAMLLAHGSYGMPKGVFVNNFLTIKLPGKDEEKMSKSRQNAPELIDYLEYHGNVDALRYYLSSIMTERSRGVYQPDALIQRYNSELANTIGNFAHRVLTFIAKHQGEIVQIPSSLDPLDQAFLDRRVEVHAKVTAFLEECECKSALEECMEYMREANRYIDARAPWKLRTSDPEMMKGVLYVSLCTLKTISVLMSPFIPHAMSHLSTMLGYDTVHVETDGDTILHSPWSEACAPFELNHRLGTPSVLFPKIEVDGSTLPIPYLPVCERKSVSDGG